MYLLRNSFFNRRQRRNSSATRSRLSKLAHRGQRRHESQNQMPHHRRPAFQRGMVQELRPHRSRHLERIFIQRKIQSIPENPQRSFRRRRKIPVQGRQRIRIR